MDKSTGIKPESYAINKHPALSHLLFNKFKLEIFIEFD